MPFRIELKPAAIKGLRGLPKSIQKQISSKIDSLATNPFPSKAKKLAGSEKNLSTESRRLPDIIPDSKEGFAYFGNQHRSSPGDL